jgi:hypothetical protein
MKSKVVLLLVSKAELLPQEGLLLLVDRTYDHPYHKKLEGSYEIVWISISDKWTDAERDIRFFVKLFAMVLSPATVSALLSCCELHKTRMGLQKCPSYCSVGFTRYG